MYTVFLSPLSGMSPALYKWWPVQCTEQVPVPSELCWEVLPDACSERTAAGVRELRPHSGCVHTHPASDLQQRTDSWYVKCYFSWLFICVGICVERQILHSIVFIAQVHLQCPFPDVSYIRDNKEVKNAVTKQNNGAQEKAGRSNLNDTFVFQDDIYSCNQGSPKSFDPLKVFWFGLNFWNGTFHAILGHLKNIDFLWVIL